MPSAELSGYRGMWLFTMFDLPVVTPEDKRNYREFHNTLVKLGFEMMQYSVYARYCPSEEASDIHRKRIKTALPPEGQVRILAITDRQFGKMESFMGRRKKSNEEKPEQMLLL